MAVGDSRSIALSNGLILKFTTVLEPFGNYIFTFDGPIWWNSPNFSVTVLNPSSYSLSILDPVTSTSVNLPTNVTGFRIAQDHIIAWRYQDSFLSSTGRTIPPSPIVYTGYDQHITIYDIDSRSQQMTVLTSAAMNEPSLRAADGSFPSTVADISKVVWAEDLNTAPAISSVLVQTPNWDPHLITKDIVSTLPVVSIQSLGRTQQSPTDHTEQLFNVHLDKPLAGTLPLVVSLAGVSNTTPPTFVDSQLNVDWILPSNQVQFQPGRQDIQVPVIITGDELIEPRKSFVLQVTSSPAYTVDPLASTAEAVIDPLNTDHPVPVNVTFQGQTGRTASETATIKRYLVADLQAAIDRVSAALPSFDLFVPNIDIAVQFKDLGANGPIAEAVPVYFEVGGPVSIVSKLFIPRTLAEYRNHEAILPGSVPDITISINTAVLAPGRRFYYTGAPDVAPIGELVSFDATTALEHEILHGLGFGMGTSNDPNLASRAFTPWDQFLSKDQQGNWFFHGTGLLDTNVPLGKLTASGAINPGIAHVLTSADDLMYAHYLPGGAHRTISALDAEMLKDLGYRPDSELIALNPGSPPPTVTRPPVVVASAGTSVTVAGLAVAPASAAGAATLYTVQLTSREGLLSISYSNLAASAIGGDADSPTVTTIDGSRIITFQGTLNSVNTALQTLAIAYGTDASATDQIAMSVVAADGASTQDLIAITVAGGIGANSAPQISAPLQATTLPGDFAAIAGISATDADSLTRTEHIKLLIESTNGQLFAFSGNLLGTVTIAGNGTPSLVVEGNIDDVNAVASSLLFRAANIGLPSQELLLTAEDGRGAVTQRTVQVVSNHNPTFIAAGTQITVSVGTDPIHLEGRVVAIDSDAGDALRYSLDNLSVNTTLDTPTLSIAPLFLTTFRVDDAGFWTVDLNPNDAQLVRSGESITLVASVKVDDGKGGTAIQQQTLTFVGSNDAPVTNADAYTTNEDVNLTINSEIGVLANDRDADRDILTATLVEGTQHGLLALHPDGSFTYQPAIGYNGPDSFIYTVSDGLLASQAATVSLTVAHVNHPATIGGTLTGSVREDDATIASGNLSIADADPDEASFRADSFGGAFGTLDLSSAGGWTYTLNNSNPIVQALNAGQILRDTITIQSFDGTNANIAITINGTDDVNVITGTKRGEFIEGTDQADVITPLGGDDRVKARDGDDIIRASIDDGRDVYDGGRGSDTIDYSALTKSVKVELENNGGIARSKQSSTDKLISIENVIGSQAGDEIDGNRFANVIEGGRGNDFLSGGGGADTFVFKTGFAYDVISDFDKRGDDIIEFSTSVFADFAAVHAALKVHRGDVIIETPDHLNSITLKNTKLASISADDFLFV